jgi:diguanylate cyclase (GGDEF)-like protein
LRFVRRSERARPDLDWSALLARAVIASDSFSVVVVSPMRRNAIVEDFRFDYLSPAAARLAARSGVQVGRTVRQALPEPGASARVAGWKARLAAGGRWTEIRELADDPDFGQGSLDNGYVDGDRLVVIGADITDWQRSEAKLRELADTDPLTGLANRRAFFHAVERELRRGQRFRHAPALLLFDLDFFKRVNDDAGHAAGDQMLAGVGRALTSAVRADELVARIGGEEFAWLLTTAAAPGAAVAAALRARAAIAGLPRPDGAPQRVSIGIAHANTNAADTPEALFERADAALYAAKRTGRDRIVATIATGFVDARTGQKLS